MSLRNRLRRLWRVRRRMSLEPSTCRILAEFEDHIEYYFKSPATLCKALTHRSYLNSNGDEVSCSNERLEFLGD